MMSGNDGMQKFTETIYKIQDVCTEMQTTLEYQLPQIVVVGSQGVGKSSILESFVGSLPSKIFKIKIEEGQLRHDIEVAVSNAYGVDGVLNTPFKAFESLAQVQISRLQGPIESCLLLVMMELNKSVQACVGKINNYPIFQEYISRDISSFLQNTIRSNLSNVLNLVEMELAYINSTNYGFGKGLGDKLLEQITSVYGSFSDDQKRHFFGDLVNQLDCHVKKPGGIVYREGILYFNDSDNPYRFVLRYDPRYEKHTLSYYDLLDNSSKYAFLTIQMDNLKFRLETDYYHRNLLSQKIVIFKPSGGEVARNILEIVLSSACESEICLWTKYLSQVIEMDGKTATGLYLKDIDEAYDKIVSYVSTVKKTMCNMVPKAIMSSIVRNVEKYIQKDLLVKMAEKLNDGLLNEKVTRIDAREEEFKNATNVRNVESQTILESGLSSVTQGLTTLNAKLDQHFIERKSDKVKKEYFAIKHDWETNSEEHWKNDDYICN
ncbi:Dynamin [Pseudolycoriella hygida]|uniref:Dynamin n=1 Tax=Pseudolycoriella hygida TaxID=35572 RepID=A0A9Q0NER3_9DIPT|nr:Dynamin [Pseudolycoriella hygida]